LRHIGFNGSFDNVTLYQLNEHSRPEDITEYLECTKDGHDIGLLSEAGLPCLADPGAYVVRLAHSKDIQVIPLTGPSSIVSAIISSGMNGQCFAFHGYLPIKSPQKENKIKSCEKYSAEFHQTQVFIEAPYRNNQLFNTLISICLPTTLLSVACNVNSDDEYISMKSISEWRKSDAPDLHKKPTVFCLLAN
jgi:16S rRNA (cytidine1402-2'-O)-methyltransferase